MLLARMSLSQVLAGGADFAWYAARAIPPFEQLDAIDFDEALLRQVHAIYVTAYRNETDKGRPLLLPHPMQLLKYDIWVLLFADGNAAAPVGFMMADTTQCGIKGGLLGTDGQHLARKAILTLKTAVLQLAGVYSEVSDDLEQKLQGKVPVVDFTTASQVLSILGKTDIRVEPDGIHYSRQIGNLGRVQKLMVGNPVVP